MTARADRSGSYQVGLRTAGRALTLAEVRALDEVTDGLEARGLTVAAIDPLATAPGVALRVTGPGGRAAVARATEAVLAAEGLGRDRLAATRARGARQAAASPPAASPLARAPVRPAPLGLGEPLLVGAVGVVAAPLLDQRLDPDRRRRVAPSAALAGAALATAVLGMALRRRRLARVAGAFAVGLGVGAAARRLGRREASPSRAAGLGKAQGTWVTAEEVEDYGEGGGGRLPDPTAADAAAAAASAEARAPGSGVATYLYTLNPQKSRAVDLHLKALAARDLRALLPGAAVPTGARALTAAQVAKVAPFVVFVPGTGSVALRADGLRLAASPAAIKALGLSG